MLQIGLYLLLKEIYKIRKSSDHFTSLLHTVLQPWLLDYSPFDLHRLTTVLRPSSFDCGSSNFYHLTMTLLSLPSDYDPYDLSCLPIVVLKPPLLDHDPPIIVAIL
ncbi:hypothetical protein KFK09_004305 [Dendrobium nobile]|uniref:Uncharacterized protein n=1 Tax=Dendrobium nobile TaxID=94219 RepID=A0A8T3C517_DENNO|nr:hypothetical protein KFK09_004305 [Dendrobium nobile]